MEPGEEGDAEIRLTSRDQQASERYEDLRALERDLAGGTCALPLLGEAVIAAAPTRGVAVTTHSASPAGAGLGGSSGLLCALIASGRGRSAALWFVFGFFLNCFAVVLVLVLPDLNEERERYERLTTENRRLKEQHRKERQVAERRHAATQRRIDVHDRALESDTAGMVEQVDAAELAPPPRPPSSAERESFERAL